MKTVLVLAALVVVIAGLRVAGGFFLPFISALFLAVISVPVVRFLERRAHLPEALAILLTVLLDIGLVVGFGALLWTSFLGFVEALPAYQLALDDLAHSTVDLARSWHLPVDYALLEELRSAGAVMGVVGDLVHELTQIVSNALMVLLLLGFLLFETRGAREKLHLLLGRANPHIEKTAIAAYEVQRYLVVKTVLSVLTGVLTGCWMAVCGLDFPLLWGLLAFLLNYIPSLGPAISLVPPVLVALLTLGPGGAAAVAAGHLSIGFVIGNVLEPRLMGKTLGLSTLVVFASMFFFFWLWGPVGALFAAPLTMLLRSALEVNEDTRWIAVLLGSHEYVESKRREWGWKTLDERASGLPPPPPPAREGDVPPPAAPPVDEMLDTLQQVREPGVGKDAAE
ncbi:Putative transport protein [Sandaracinus amylolyticus]|uniref:Putative transport protein n=1 Tax=Sandaracinus amylolyticus TaxID=927083 RepID=A0A0F6SGS2_9BACT|nr:Putative transport protein [Sandaracinus amylolyticus]